jgi:uncharacterized protein YidB (DUF937 family)
MPTLDDLLGQLTGQGEAQGSAQHKSLAESVIKMLSDGKSGGLASLVNSFASSGLADQVASWVGLSENKPISADQVSRALGQDRLDNIAKQSGVDTNNATEILAQILPKIVDKLTPEGKVPDGDALQKGLAGLAKMVGGAA